MEDNYPKKKGKREDDKKDNNSKYMSASNRK